MTIRNFRFRLDLPQHALTYDEENPTFDDEYGGLDESLLYYTDSE